MVEGVDKDFVVVSAVCITQHPRGIVARLVAVVHGNRPRRVRIQESATEARGVHVSLANGYPAGVTDAAVGNASLDVDVGRLHDEANCRVSSIC